MDYFRAGEERAYSLGNRGPLRFADDGTLHPEVLATYWQHGFYVFEGVLGEEELGDLRSELADLLDRAPVAPEAELDRRGRRAFGEAFTTPVFSFGKPLSDPYGGTDANYGRHPAKMSEPRPAEDAPLHTVFFINSILQVMDSCLRLYGHPQLLKATEAINGADFAPFGDSIWIKEPGLGTSVAWHQDGTTHWNHPRWDEGIHGFNFMAQLCRTTPENALWVVPGSHKRGKIDIKAEVAACGSDRLPDAVPMLCEPGDIAICNRQALHGSFANTSRDRRVSIVFGFHRRDAVAECREAAAQWGRSGVRRSPHPPTLPRDPSSPSTPEPNAFPGKRRTTTCPSKGKEAENRWNEQTRQTVLKNYNLLKSRHLTGLLGSSPNEVSALTRAREGRMPSLRRPVLVRR